MRDRMVGPKGGFDRRVTRIVTPGTLIDEPFLNPYENNYLLAVTHSNDSESACVGLAWTDVSTGDFFTQRTTIQALRDELVRIGPKEIVLDASLKGDQDHAFHQAINEEGLFVSYAVLQDNTPTDLSPSETTGDDLSLVLKPPMAPGETSLSDVESNAVQLLTAFMHANLLEHMPHLSSPSRESTAGRMQIDAHTIKALEIRESMREGGPTGSLFSVVKRTVTSSGTRLLARWLCEYAAKKTMMAS